MSDTATAEPPETATRAFYVPATFQFSTEQGGIERLLVGLFHERGDLEARVVTEDDPTEFYVPAMYQFSTDPGRLERFLKRVFAERGERMPMAVPDDLVDIFYLPAVDPDRYRGGAADGSAPLEPAAEALTRDRTT